MPKKCTPPYSNYQDCLKSVSDGKSLVASTITANGVATSANASFAVLNANISSMVGSKVGINVFTQPYEPGIKEGVWIQTSVPYNKIITDPYVLNQGGQWGSVMTDLPYNFYYGSAVVYNGEIHILGGYDYGTATNHYAWNGSSWRSVSILPYNFYYGSAVVYNGEIHILGSHGGRVGTTNHYAWNGSSWRNVSTLPYDFEAGSAVVYNGEIHILGGGESKTNHYAWNGSSWRSVSTLPYNFYYGSAVVYNGEIHILGGYDYDGVGTTNYYAWNGSSWRNASTLPYEFYSGSAVVYNGEIHILGSDGGSSSTKYYTKHYAWNGSSWESVSTLPYEFYSGSAVVYGKSIYIVSNTKYCAFTSPDKLFDPHTVIIQKGNVTSGVYQTCFSDTFGKITGGNNRFLSGFDDIWYFVETSLDTSSPIYYGNGSGWLRIKN